MGNAWMMSWQPFFPSHSLGSDFMECVYVWVRGDAPPIPSSAFNLSMIMQKSPNLSDSSHLPYLSRCLGEFNQIKLNELTDLLWRYHLTSNPWHLPNNSNEVGALSQVQDTARQKLDCACAKHSKTRIKCTFASVIQARSQIAVEDRASKYVPCLPQERLSLLGRTEKGNCWFQIKVSTSTSPTQHFPSVPKLTCWTNSLEVHCWPQRKISFNKTSIFSGQKWHFLPLPLFSAAAQKSWHLPSARAWLCLWSWNPSRLCWQNKN